MSTDRGLFQKQIDFKPEIKNHKGLEFDNVIIGGMGGSALPARILFFLQSSFPAWLHNDYGFPDKVEGKALCIAISYSGNTEEVISFTQEALKRKLPLATISSGGKLGKIAEENSLSYILIPQGIQPRDSVIYMLKALLTFLHQDETIKQIENIDIEELAKGAEDLALGLKNKIPIIYSSISNHTLGYIWKINFNENAKIPSWNNFFPELTHNEMQGMAGISNKALAKDVKVLLLQDEEDNAGDKRQMQEFVEEMKSRVEITPIKLPAGRVAKLLYTLILARETSHFLAKFYGINPENVDLVESFKKRLV